MEHDKKIQVAAISGFALGAFIMTMHGFRRYEKLRIHTTALEQFAKAAGDYIVDMNEGEKDPEEVTDLFNTRVTFLNQIYHGDN